MAPLRSVQISLILACMLLSAGCGAPPAQDDALRYIKADDGSTSAVVIDRDASLLFTSLLVPTNLESGASDQFADLVAQLDAVLEEAGSTRDDVVRLNVYAAEDSAAALVRRAAAEVFDTEPAVTLVVGALKEPRAKVTLDAVATTTAAASIRDSIDPARTVAAILPPKGRVFVSGQAADRATLRDAVAGTMESLHATLAYLGISADDVVQVKIFMAPMDSAGMAENVVASYYRGTAPPLVSTEWTNTFRPVEIELIAHRSEAPAEDAPVSYITPAGMTSSSAFSRVVEVHDGDLIFTSGLTGDPSSSSAGEVSEIFERLGAVLEEAGSGYGGLIKATYYYTDRSARDALGEIRRQLYDPQRPPAASLIGTRSLQGSDFLLDMIAVSQRSD